MFDTAFSRAGGGCQRGSGTTISAALFGFPIFFSARSGVPSTLEYAGFIPFFSVDLSSCKFPQLACQSMLL